MTDTIETQEDAPVEMIETAFSGSPTDPVRAVVNGAVFEYERNRVVQVPAHVLDVLLAAGNECVDPESLPAFVPEGDGAALADEAEGDGGDGSGGTVSAVKPDISILDGNVDAVRTAIEGMGIDDLSALLAAEQTGKARKGVIDAIETLIAAAA